MLLIIHADHEQNCSTSTMRMSAPAGRTCSPPSPRPSAACGPPPRGRTRASSRCSSHPGRRRQHHRFLDQVKKGESKIRLMGFGHRVYKNFDPRATLLKRSCDKLFNELGIHDRCWSSRRRSRSTRSRRVLRQAQAVPERRLLQRHHLPRDGHPTEMFTVMFLLGRLPGGSRTGGAAHGSGRSHPPPVRSTRARPSGISRTAAPSICHGR